MRWLTVLVAVPLSSSAHAAEVVWLTTVMDGGAYEAQVVAAAQPKRGSLRPIDLLSAAGDARMADRSAHDALEQTLQDVRAYETRLDGELVIMDDVQRALDRIETLPGEVDRDRVFRALAYQGFAVHRFFAETLADDERGEDFRVEVNDLTYVRPWALALALEPDRELTPYEVAESPQRIAYAEQARVYGTEVLPGTLAVADTSWLDDGGVLYVDGLAAEGAEHKLLPGVHWVHLEKDGHVVDSARLDVESGRTTSWSLQRSASGWDSWLATARAGGMPEPDEGLKADVLALGGEVWFVVAGKKGPQTLALTVTEGGASSWRQVELSAPRRGVGGDDDDGLSAAVGLGVGWLYSGDFYTQDPVSAPHTPGTVNSLVLDLDLELAYDVGPARIIAGMDTLLTPGAHHVALTGDGAMRVRPTPFVGGGIDLAQVTVGYVLPYHLALGGRVAVPVTDGLEVQARGWVGLPGDRKRSNGSVYEARALTTLQVGAGWRFR